MTKKSPTTNARPRRILRPEPKLVELRDLAELSIEELTTLADAFMAAADGYVSISNQPRGEGNVGVMLDLLVNDAFEAKDAAIHELAGRQPSTAHEADIRGAALVEDAARRGESIAGLAEMSAALAAERERVVQRVKLAAYETLIELTERPAAVAH